MQLWSAVRTQTMSVSSCKVVIRLVVDYVSGRARKAWPRFFALTVVVRSAMDSSITHHGSAWFLLRWWGFFHAPEVSGTIIEPSVQGSRLRVGRERTGTPFPFFFYTTGTSFPLFFSRAPSVSCATRLKLSICLFFLSGNIFRTAEPVSTKVCTVTATGQE